MCNCTRLLLCDEHLRQQVIGGAFRMPLPDYEDCCTISTVIPTPVPPPIQRTINWGYFNEDPTAAITAGTAVFQFSKQLIIGFINSGALNFTASGDQKFLAVQVDADQTTFNKWSTPGVDGGSIPDFAYQVPVVANGKRFIVSRNIQTLDTSNPTITFSHV